MCPMSTNPSHPDPPEILEYQGPSPSASGPTTRDLLVGVLLSVACLALSVWVGIAYIGGIFWLSGQYWLIGVSMLLSAIVATPPACYAAEAAQSLFTGKTARRRA
jgi:hypothetical protein